MSRNPNEHYSLEEKEAMADELQDRESLPGHYAVDDGYCSCGVLCETGTRFRAHLRALAAERLEEGEKP